ncbi:MAG: enoyl-CoA hydratase/isomerase family protein [Proteobacteria bacterium]|nr:enoyl-CoA hydratase/isomerase family protein [Pseudomonadota bacterium]MBS0493887.1 enoyl-CoA hydratase/isomerase family protein [Pseudomonadota bacterium]
MADNEVLYQVDGHVATITLNRPERLNAITRTMLDNLGASLLQANQDPQVRAVVLTGADKAFCVGLDIQDALTGNSIGSEQTNSSVQVDLDLRKAPPTVLHHMDKPTICVLNGSAAGYGMDLALGCDLRIMSAQAKLSPAFVKRGVVPESGGTWYLPRMLGWSKAAQVIFTGRMLDLSSCLELGLVDFGFSNDEEKHEAMGVVEEICNNAPLAVQSAKRLMRMGLAEGFNDHVHHVFLQFSQLARTHDFKEGMRSFMEKRPAHFIGK